MSIQQLEILEKNAFRSTDAKAPCHLPFLFFLSSHLLKLPLGLANVGHDA